MQFTFGNGVMIGIACLLFYLAIKHEFEPLLLLPIGFGALLANLPATGLLQEPSNGNPGGFFYYISQGIHLELFPPIIFLGIGALTDFGPLIARPVTLLLGAAAQLGVFTALLGSIALGFTPQEASAIGIIGGADGPTCIFLTSKLAPHLMGPIAVAAYSYMALVPLIQPPIMRWLTSKKERAVVMTEIRHVSKLEKIIFPILVMIPSLLLVPVTAPLLGMLMLGNIFKESGVVGRLTKTAQNELINLVTIFLGTSVGMTMSADIFLKLSSIKIIVLGCIAFSFSTVGGVLLGKLFYVISKGKINPLIGAAGVSAVPMAARVVQKVGQEENENNFLLMHAMGPNVAGVIGTAIAAGVLLSIMK